MTPHQSIAHYRVTAKLGEGGMGEVWRATDTKLNRDVAIKLLPSTFASDADRMARFAREAQVLASLNHPNIAAIYGVEERALVLELVEGPTLADRIARGAMPTEEALPIAVQIAEALEYAHEKGIIHRDLKPANIKITLEGRVKILDFGLAKAMSSETGPSGDAMSSPTLTMRATMAGTIMGTAAYMSPEQARGQAVDKRSDIWAFGVVLHEMLTGRALFAGPTISDTLAAVLKTEPDVASVPGQVRPVVERCLRKDPKRRWRDIGDVRVALEEGVPVEPSSGAPRRGVLSWAVTALALVAAAAGWFLAWRATRPLDQPLTRLSVDLGPDALLGLDLTVAISPDGRRLVFPMRGPGGRPQLAVRQLDQAQPTPLYGTEGGSDPFFSPDGTEIGFFAGGVIKRVSVQGGAIIQVCIGAGIPQGATWGEDGNIIAAFGAVNSLQRVSAAGGGTPSPLTKLGPGESTHRWPQILPGGDAVLFTSSPSATSHDNDTISVVRLKTGQVKPVFHGGYHGRYLPSGHLVYVHQGVLYGVRFDLARLEIQGTPTPLLPDVAGNVATGGGQFDFSAGGTFVYAAGSRSAQSWTIALLDSTGKLQPLVAVPGTYGTARVSPDGNKLAFTGEGADIYIYDPERETSNRLTFSGRALVPVWAPDGKHLAGSVSSRNGIDWMRADVPGSAVPLVETPDTSVAWSFSPDGRRLAYFTRDQKNGFDLWTLPLDLTDPEHPKPGKPEPFLQSPADEIAPRFSPDGRWIAYRSNESGTDEVYVRPFPPGNGGKWQISSGGGLYGIWSKNGRELFYETADNQIMVLDYSVDGASFVRGKPRLWSSRRLFYAGTSNIDLMPDGKHFAVLAMPQDEGSERGSVHVTMLLNFFDEVRRRIAAGAK